jgi:hypothetical protein
LNRKSSREVARTRVNLRILKGAFTGADKDRVGRVAREGHDEVSIIGEMFDCMPFFKMLLDSGQDTMDELCRRFSGFYHYAKILEKLAAGIQSGDIQVPK